MRRLQHTKLTDLYRKTVMRAGLALQIKCFKPCRHQFVLLLIAVTGSIAPAMAVDVADEWSAVEAEARGQTVYFNAWGGSDRINEYIGWVGDQVQARYGVTLEHVKVGDIAEIVGQLDEAW